MINLEQSDIPVLFLCIPTDLNPTSGFVGWCKSLKRRTLDTAVDFPLILHPLHLDATVLSVHVGLCSGDDV